MLFAVDAEDEDRFQHLYASAYLPALRRQEGFLRSSLSQAFPPAAAAESRASDLGGNYLMELDFTSEESRRRWVATADHDVVSQAAVALSHRQVFCGYDVIHA